MAARYTRTRERSTHRGPGANTRIPWLTRAPFPEATSSRPSPPARTPRRRRCARSRCARSLGRGWPDSGPGRTPGVGAWRDSDGPLARPCGWRRTPRGHGPDPARGRRASSSCRGRISLIGTLRGIASPGAGGDRAAGARRTSWPGNPYRRYTVRRLRPRSRRRLRTARPPRVLMRSRKPCTFFRRRLCG